MPRLVFAAALVAIVSAACGGALDEPNAPNAPAAPHAPTSAVENGEQKEPLMPTSNILVVYYSRTGTTRALAETIAANAHADLVPIVDTVDRRGFRGFVRSIVDAAKKKESRIAPFPVDVGAYDVVAVGTPDWGKSTSAPVRTFLEENRGRFKRVAFFLTDGTADHALVFEDMAKLAGAKPIATLGIPHDDVVEDKHRERAAAFAQMLVRSATAIASQAPAQAASP